MAEQSAPNSALDVQTDQNPNSVDATIVSGADFTAAESTCNNATANAEKSVLTSEGEGVPSLEMAQELMARGAAAASERDYTEATDLYSRALEIKVAHFGQLAPECVDAYYKYGCALLYKAQDESDALGSMPKKGNDGSVKSDVKGESSVASASNNGDQAGSVNGSNDAPAIEENDEGEVENGNEEGEADGANDGEDESDTEELAGGDEDESDLDLALKMLDIARDIVGTQPGDTMEKVDIFSALAETSMEREDFESSLRDYSKSLSILESLVEPDSRLIAELNFRICLCLELDSKPAEAVPYCEKAISVCKSRVQRLTNELNLLKSEDSNGSEQAVKPSSSSTSVPGESAAGKEAEIETLTGLLGDLEKKLEDLQHLVSNPTSILSDIYEMISAKLKAAKEGTVSAAGSSSQMAVGASGSGSAESQSVSTAQTTTSSAVTHLGVVGRGVKRVVMSTVTDSNPPAKKPATDPSSGAGSGST